MIMKMLMETTRVIGVFPFYLFGLGHGTGLLDVMVKSFFFRSILLQTEFVSGYFRRHYEEIMQI